MDNHDNRGSRIVVAGITGSAKTLLARELSSALGFPHVELDAPRRDLRGSEVDKGALRQWVESALQSDEWVVDGDYRFVRDLMWPRATTFVWLDYRLPRVMWQLFRRHLAELRNGEHARTLSGVIGWDSPFPWAFKTHSRYRKSYPAELSKPEHLHLEVVHLRYPRETRLWLRRATQV